MMELFYVDGPSFRAPLPVETSEAISQKVFQIKEEAERRLTALDWRLQRARERGAIGEVGVESEYDVLVLREQIRQASNAAEAVVRELGSVADVVAFSW